MPEPAAVASFIPADPVRVLVLGHGYPWVDGSQSDHFLAEYAHAAVERWTAFARTHHAIVVAPAFGGSDFGGWRAGSRPLARFRQCPRRYAGHPAAAA